MRKKILVVDDQPLIAKLMSTLLEKEGHRVVTAVDGLSALDALKEFTPDVIFLDLIMPNIGGEKFCRIIRTMPELKDTYVVILSGIAKELLAVKRHFEVVLESMSEGILEVTRDTRIVYADPTALSLIGMHEEYLSRIYDPYFTTKEMGRGLGLATAYSIIRKHDGLITTKSESGRGARFDIFLPASDRAAHPKKDHHARVDSNRGRVLLMDDDETVREIVGEMLKSLGYSTRLASDGGEAIILYLNAREFGEPFDIVILDLTVSLGMGGLETIQKLLTIDPLAKAIVSSGHTADPVMLRCREYGFKGALDKPFKMGDLKSLMERVMAEVPADPSQAG
jgi:CheY-like chemotaxis protein